jgi:XRE family aerobic/anaerobic benzoate catabolism transcriptional regulator
MPTATVFARGARGASMGRDASDPTRDPFLLALGERIRTLRARRGMTRKALAREAAVSERHLANLESGVGNASILVLRQVAQALDCAVTDVLSDNEQSPERVLLKELLEDRSERDLKRARIKLTQMFGTPAAVTERRGRIALIGLRGAGKTTLGQMLAADLGMSFLELNREIERLAGCSVGEIHSLYGASAYRRYEHRALQETLRKHDEVVIATPGGLVSDAATFNLLLEQCFSVWLQATPEEHMNRVIAQGDFRPMAGNAEAMDDLKRILAGRDAFYAKADLVFSTSGQSLKECFARLRSRVRAALPRLAASA